MLARFVSTVAFWLTSILITRPLLSKCTGSLMSKVLKASVSISDVTSLNDGVTISSGKGAEKEDVIIVGDSGEIVWSVFKARLLKRPVCVQPRCRIGILETFYWNVSKNARIWIKVSINLACVRGEFSLGGSTAHLNDHTVKSTNTLWYFEQLGSCGRIKCL